ncbi:MAG: putative 4-mercaptohistidine N1-methyltransferase [Gammaproteobacteria bacterium]|nr:putative 4-mercaptohistidine N1-methyltransferase [Gammaproteobacteria bacterium]
MPDYYETDAQVNEYLVFHYADIEQTLRWEFGPHQAFGFHARLADCIDASQLPADSRALDLGCAVGRTSFELSRRCSEVLGIDFSHVFIDTANRILNSGEIPLLLKREGQLGDAVTNHLPEGVNPERVGFSQGDAENLPESIGRFDAITFANVLDRLLHPRRALDNLAVIANPGAQLVVCSPFTWWDEFTIAEERLGGFSRNGEEVTSHDSIVSALEPNFRLKTTCDLPFLIREHERKFHFSVAQTSLWIRLDN